MFFDGKYDNNCDVIAENDVNVMTLRVQSTGTSCCGQFWLLVIPFKVYYHYTLRMPQIGLYRLSADNVRRSYEHHFGDFREFHRFSRKSSSKNL